MQASKQASKQANKQASKQATKQATRKQKVRSNFVEFLNLPSMCFTTVSVMLSSRQCMVIRTTQQQVYARWNKDI